MENINIEQRITEIIGEASMCWTETPSGVFKVEKALELVDEIMAFIELKIPNK